MSYTPITVTQYNLEWAIRENMRLIYAELAYKLGESNPLPLKANLDLGGARLKTIANPVNDHDAANRNTLDGLL